MTHLDKQNLIRAYCDLWQARKGERPQVTEAGGWFSVSTIATRHIPRKLRASQLIEAIANLAAYKD